MPEYIFAIALFLVGLYAVALKKDLVRILFGIIIMEYSADLLLGSFGERSGATALVGLAVVILFIALAVRLRDQFGTVNITKIRELKG